MDFWECYSALSPETFPCFIHYCVSTLKCDWYKLVLKHLKRGSEREANYKFHKNRCHILSFLFITLGRAQKKYLLPNYCHVCFGKCKILGHSNFWTC